MRFKARTPKPGTFRAPVSRDVLRRAGHFSTDKASQGALLETRSKMTAAGMGKATRAIGQLSSTKRNTLQKDFAWGSVHLRDKSERTVGMFASFTQETTTIVPRSPGGWLWIPSGRIPSKLFAGKTDKGGRKFTRMTRGGYNRASMQFSLGQLEFVPRGPKLAFLIIRDVTIDARGRNAKRDTGGRLKVRRRKPFVVAFIGIKRTRRQQRINPDTIALRWSKRQLVFIRQSIEAQTRN